MYHVVASNNFLIERNIELHNKGVHNAPTSVEMNQLAILFNAGHHAEVESRARSLLERHPGFGFGWKVLGAALKIQGKDALSALQHATVLLPDDAEAHRNLGVTLHDLGQLEDAATSFRRALAMKHDYAEAYYDLGNTLQALGNCEDAVVNYGRAVESRPNYFEAHANLGMTLQKLDQLDGAVTSFRRALELEPDLLAELHLNLADALKGLGRLDDAVESYRKALEIEPVRTSVEVHNNLGNCLLYLRKLDEAVVSYRRALHIDPSYADAHNNLGVTLHDLGQFDDAVASYRKALTIRPAYSEAYYNLGNALQALGNSDDAATSYRRALELKPNYVEAHSNLGIALQRLGQLDGAVASYRKALEVKVEEVEDAVKSYRQAMENRPDFAVAQVNLGQALLLSGELSEGWQKCEFRWEGGTPRQTRVATNLPKWSGEIPKSGDGIIIFVEQGMGDKLQFVRYLPLVASRFSGRISIVAGNSLQTLFCRSFPNWEVLDSIPVDHSAWQWQCPLLSLPLAFNTTLETIPRTVPYLVPDPKRVEYWKRKIETLGLPDSVHKVGVVWKSGRRMENADLRSLSLQQLHPLLTYTGFQFFSLQKEPDENKAPCVAAGKLIDWSDEFNDFDDTAALTQNLDLIISVDTSVAHLAGGLGRPTWLLNRHASEWRWMRGREDSPWYPTMRIFTQTRAGDWDDVVSVITSVFRGMRQTKT